LGFIVLLSLVFSPYVNAGHVACGATLIEDTVLDSDLICNGTSAVKSALIIGANNITLDCAEHFIIGNVTKPGFPPDEIGINSSSRLNVTIKNCQIKSFEEGILLYRTSFSTLENNTLAQNVLGIHLFYSDFNILVRNIAKNISSGGGAGIFLERSSHNMLMNNTVRSHGFGMYFLYSDFNNILNNLFENNGQGISLSSSSHTIVAYNILNNNFGGFYASYSSNNTLLSNIVRNSSVGFSIGRGSYYHTLINNTAVNGGMGFYLDSYFEATSHLLVNNTAYNNSGYHFLIYGANNTLQSNIASEGKDTYRVFGSTGYNQASGFYIVGSYNTLISNIARNNNYGIRVRYPFNTLVNNSMENNTYNFGVDQGSDKYRSFSAATNEFINNIDATNTIEGKPIYYLANKKDLVISPETGYNDSGYLGIVNSTNITVKNLNLKGNNLQGILLAGISDSLIENITVSRNIEGISLYYSSHNQITSSKISSNIHGIYLLNSSQNTLSNNLINNHSTIGGNGVLLQTSHNNTFFNNTASNNSEGFHIWSYTNYELYESYNNFLLFNMVNDNDIGFDVDNSNNNTLISNIAQNNKKAFKIGRNSHNNRLINNTVIATNPALVYPTGFHIDYSSIKNMLVANNASDMPQASFSFFIEGGKDNAIKNNYGTMFRIDYSENNLFEENVANRFYIYRSKNNLLKNNMQKNSSSKTGFLVWDSMNNSFINNTAQDNAQEGFRLYISSKNTLKSNTIINNSIGISIERGGPFDPLPDENLIYNNFFNNTINAKDSGANYWNIEKTPEINILGGPFLGGNFWHDYKGKDVNGDFLGDTEVPYTSNKNISVGGDFLPLVTLVNDSDKDDIPDGEDNCPLIFNPQQEDTDDDKVGDSCDNCPSIANYDQFDNDQDGVGDICETDDDNDGVADETDNCPLDFNLDQNDTSPLYCHRCDAWGCGPRFGEGCSNPPGYPDAFFVDGQCCTPEPDGIGDACTGDLRIHKWGTAAVPGRNMDYFITVENVGRGRARDILVFEFLEQWFDLISLSPSPINVTNRTIFWDVSSLQSGEFITFSYLAHLKSETSLNSNVNGGPFGYMIFPRPVIIRLPTPPARADAVNQVIQQCIREVHAPCMAKIPEKCTSLTGIEKCLCEQLESLKCNDAFQRCISMGSLGKGKGSIFPSCVTRPRDPNEKGVNAEKFIKNDQSLTYSIHFENIGDIEAKDVFLTDILDEDLNLSTLAIFTLNGTFVPLQENEIITLKEENKTITRNITLGDQTIEINESYIENWTVSLKGRTLSWNLLNINLPVNESGFVLFSIKPDQGLESGTEIRNNATIQFEIFETITTNTVENIIDEISPKCEINPLPAITRTENFTVSWNATDAVGEIEGIDIFVSEDFVTIDGKNVTNFTLLQTTTENNTLFEGKPGKFYAFYCQARDIAGNVGSGNVSGTIIILDKDGDGIRDAEDNCQDTPNPTQTDLDKDGLGDACDIQTCNNSKLEALEECDTSDFAGKTCKDIGFDNGILLCSTTCTFDKSLCVQYACGNGKIEALEECDDGNLKDIDGCSSLCKIETLFLRGDSNNDGKVDISDPINTLNVLFSGSGNITCQDAADANDDNKTDISDAILTLNFLFSGGKNISAPHPGLGIDPTIDNLTCAFYNVSKVSGTSGGGGGGGSVQTVKDALNETKSNKTLDNQTKSFLVNYLESLPKGTLSISSTPSSAYIYLDGIYKGLTPRNITNMTSGNYTLKLTKYRYYDYKAIVNIQSGKITKLSPTLLQQLSTTPSPSPSPSIY